MSHFESMSHTSPLRYAYLLETRSILEVYNERGKVVVVVSSGQ
jgi:hypothetical protein